MKRSTALTLLLISLLVSACELPVRAAASPPPAVRAWFDAPLPGTVFFPPNPCRITAHGASPNGIAQFELTVNERAQLIPASADEDSLVTLVQDCGESEPGEYFLTLRAQDTAGHWSSAASTSFLIGLEDVAPTQADTPTPTPTPAADTPAGVYIDSLSTTLVYVARSGCDPREVTIIAHAVEPQGITVVVLFYRFKTASSTTEFQSLAMDPIGGDLYRRALNPYSLLGGTVPFDQAILEYQVVVQRPDGDTSLRTPVLADINLRACGAAPPGPTTSPSPTPTPPPVVH